MNTFVINGKTYTAKTFDFNTVCDLEDLGISMQETMKKPMSAIRGYFALCCGRDTTFAGEELEKHIESGGNFDDISNAMAKEIEKSDFFQSLTKNKTEKA